MYPIHGPKDWGYDGKVIANLTVIEGGDIVVEPSAHADAQDVVTMLRMLPAQVGMDIDSPGAIIRALLSLQRH